MFFSCLYSCFLIRRYTNMTTAMGFIIITFMNFYVNIVMNLAISFDILRNRGIDSHVVCFVWSHLLNCHLYQVCVWTAELDMFWCPYNNHFLFTITAASKQVKRNFPINFFLRYSLGNMYFHNTQTVTSTQSYMSGAFLLKVTW